MKEKIKLQNSGYKSKWMCSKFGQIQNTRWEESQCHMEKLDQMILFSLEERELDDHMMAVK